MDKIVKFGFSNVHVAKLIEQNNAINYDTPFAIPGGVSFNQDPQGDTVFYADNMKYFIGKNGYTGSLVIANVPNEFLIKILGMKEDANGAIIENTANKESRFALMCEVDGDPNKNRVVFYDCTATRPSIEYSTTEEGKEVKTATMEITMAPRSTDGQVKASLPSSTTNKEAYNNFFNSVYEEEQSASV